MRLELTLEGPSGTYFGIGIVPRVHANAAGEDVHEGAASESAIHLARAVQ
jgi:hypothetical protein